MGQQTFKKGETKIKILSKVKPQRGVAPASTHLFSHFDF
jgi:hypothetical protein